MDNHSHRHRTPTEWERGHLDARQTVWQLTGVRRSRGADEKDVWRRSDNDVHTVGNIRCARKSAAWWESQQPATSIHRRCQEEHKQSTLLQDSLTEGDEAHEYTMMLDSLRCPVAAADPTKDVNFRCNQRDSNGEDRIQTSMPASYRSSDLYFCTVVICDKQITPHSVSVFLFIKFVRLTL